MPMRTASILLMSLVVVVSCGDSGGPAGSPRLTVDPLLDSLFVGDTIDPGVFTATYVDAMGDTQPTGQVIWSSTDEDVIVVDSLTGRVIGVGPGEAVVGARANGIAAGALLVVLRPLQVSLLLDTIYVMAGDTITVPVAVERQGGGAPAAWFSPSPNPAIYTIDSATGLLTAVSPGGPVRFIVHADTVTDTGAVDVRLLTDTTGGRTYFTVLGTAIRRTSAEARAVNYRRTGDTLTFRLNSGFPTTSNAVENVVITLRDPVAAPGTFDIDSISPAEAFGSGADPICRPKRAWSLWSTRPAGPDVTALSRDGGTITVTRIVTVTGGLAISGRFRFDAQRTDFYSNPLGVVPVRGTFVAPLITDLRPCGS
jgi:hypothetical protein